jgi:hypothetical protein
VLIITAGLGGNTMAGGVGGHLNGCPCVSMSANSGVYSAGGSAAFWYVKKQKLNTCLQNY